MFWDSTSERLKPTLGLTLVIVWVAKIGVLPRIRDYVPFLIAIVSLGLAWIFSSREREPTTYRFILAYIIIDGILTMAIYGVLIYAVF